MRRRGIWMAFFLAAGCGSETERTYYKDVKPILDAKCASCHTEGGIGPFPIETFGQASAHGADIQLAVIDRTMPPWLASPDCADYQADRSLDDQQIELVSDWVNQGMVAGDPAEEPPPLGTDDPGLTRVDLRIGMSEDYTPQRGPDDFRCFVLDWPETRDRFVTGFNIRPGRTELVHHVILFIAPPGTVEEYQRLDAAEAGPGYTCYGGPGLSEAAEARWLGAWAPGGQGLDLPAGTGISMQAGSKVVLQVHYNLRHASGGAAPDRTEIDLKLDDQVQKPALIQPWTNPQWLAGQGMRIPAQTADVKHSFAYPFPLTVMVHGAGLHMHTLGTSATLQIRRAGGGSDCLLDIPRWDFNWQRMYTLRQPVRLNAGDSLSLECQWNNTTDRNIAWGEGTDDEMCLGLVYLTAP